MLILDKAGTDKLLLQLEKQEAFDSRYQFCKVDGGLELLGTGGFSSVYEMYDSVAPKRHYAMKIIGLGEKTADEDFIFETTQIQYFLGEQSENVMRIINLWIMKVHLDETGNVTGITGVNEEEYEEAGGIPVQLVLMEKLDPVLLKDKYGNVEVLREDLKSEEEVLRLAKDIGSALSTAHENGIIHRDVKLENIFWDEHLQQYKLGDFGVARYVENGDAETVVFTDGYGAPEIERHLTEAYDLTVDIYSFGISLFLLMNGLKFPASDEYRSVFVQYSKDFIMPAPENASEDLARIIRKMCSYSAEERYQSIEEVLLEINRVKCSYEKVDGTEYEDLETETYRDEEDTVLSADQKTIEENGTQKDTDEEEWWTKDDSELSREQRIIKERCYNEAYREGVERISNYKGSDMESDGRDPNVESTELKSTFSRDNFKPENTYDATCSKEFSDLKNKNVMEISSMGTEESEIKRAVNGEIYTPEEISKLKEAREKIENPKSDTIMQKVVAVDTGEIEKDLKAYLNPTVWDLDLKVDTGIPCDCKIYGFVSKAEDTAPYTTTPEQCYETLRLDYEGTQYTNPNQSVYVVRYIGDTGQYEIPYSKEFGGHRSDGQPFTGNGYTGSPEYVVPEYVSSGTTPTAGEIYRVNPDGTEEAVAYYASREKVFELYD